MKIEREFSTDPIKRVIVVCKVCKNPYWITDRYLDYYYCPLCREKVENLARKASETNGNT